jgi:SpoIID/LytB domain protein
MQQRLGWLLVALFLIHKLPILQSAHGLPLEPRKLASELRVTPKIVRVKLSDLGRVMVIKGTDLALSLAKKPELGNVRADEWVVDCKRSLIIQPLTGKSRVIPRSGVLIESLSGILAINERRFREQIVVYPKELLSPYDSTVRKNVECLVVNHINVEKYLESVVNAEFNSQWAEEAVQAQIIASRTYALYQMKEMRKDKGRVFDVESTQKDQVYLGLDNADSRGSQLVVKTKGMIMVAKTSKNLDPIKAFFSASCGGLTSLPQQVWGARFAGFTKKVPCPYCAGSPSFSWDYRLSFVDIEKKIARGLAVDTTNRKVWPAAYIKNQNRWTLSQLKAVGGMMDDVPHKDHSMIASAHADENDHRVQKLVFEFIDRKDPKTTLKVKMDAYQARNWLGPAQLKSTLFSLSTEGRSIVFKGKGSGHGVGMCQWGAKRMGEKGFKSEQILTHYYPGVKIARIW